MEELFEPIMFGWGVKVASRASKILRDLKNFRKATENFLTLYLKSTFMKPPYPVKLRSGEVRDVKSRDELFRIIYMENHPNTYFEGKVKKVILGRDVEIMRLNNGDIFRAFVEEEYGDLQVQGKVVVDVGASVGDSAIIFAASGSKMVYAYEPYLKSYKRAVENVNSNGLQNSIKLINKGLGKPRIATVDPNYVNHNSSSLTHEAAGGIEIPVITLEDVIRENRVDNAVLKMDCEGCEYESILGASVETLRRLGFPVG